MAKKPNPGDTVSTGYLYDTEQKTFVVGPDWTRDEVSCLRRLTDLGHDLALDAVNAKATITSWTDECLQSVDIWALNSEHASAEAGDFPDVWLTPPTTQAAGEQTDTATDPPAGGDTQSASDAGSGAGPEPDPAPVATDPPPTGPTPAAAADAAADPEPEPEAVEGDPEPQADPEPAADEGVTSKAAIYPDALAALRDMGASRYGLYRYPGEPGALSKFGASGPEHESEVVRDLVDAGLAVEELSGGAHGSVKITDAGLLALKRLAPAPL